MRRLLELTADFSKKVHPYNVISLQGLHFMQIFARIREGAKRKWSGRKRRFLGNVGHIIFGTFRDKTDIIKTAT